MVPLPPRSELAILRGALTEPQAPFWDRVVDLKDRFLRDAYDKNAPLKWLSGKTGLPVHQLAQVVPGARAYGEDIIRKFIEPVLKPLGKDIPRLEEYMVIMRAEDIRAGNPAAVLPGGLGSTGKTLAEFQAEIGPERFKAVEDAAEALWGAPGRPREGLFYKNILKPLQDEGIRSADDVLRMQTSNPHYIDFSRQTELNQILGISQVAQPASIGSTGIKRLKLGGSARPLDEPLARTLQQIISVQERVARNRAATALFEALDSLGQAKVQTGLTTAAGNVPIQTGAKLPEIGNGVISFFRDGKQITAEVPEVYATVAKGLEAEAAMGTLGKFLTFFPNILRQAATTYNPAFVIINPIRDFVTAGFNQGWRVVIGPEYIEGWVAALTKNQAFSDAAKDGVLMSGIIESFRETRDLSRIGQRTALGSFEIPMNSLEDILKFVPRVIREMNTVSERATRIGSHLYWKGKKVGGLEAGVKGRDVTMDFSKSGNAIKGLNRAVPFLNAGIQGTANTLRVLKEGGIKNGMRNAFIRGAPLGLAAVALDQSNRQFASYDKIPDYEFKNNWIWVYAEGEQTDARTGETTTFPLYLKLPKGPTGALLTAPAELALKFARVKGDMSAADELMGALGSMGETLSPVSISPASLMLSPASTLGEIVANKQFFTGQPLVPEKEMKRPPESRFGPETTRQAIALGQLTKRSPREFDLATREIAAGAGLSAGYLLDKALGIAGYNPPVPGEALAPPQTLAKEIAATPVISRFFGAKSNEEERRAYAQLDKVTEDSQRRLAKAYPTTVRLDVSLTKVEDNITRNGQTLYFTPAERVRLQQMTYEAIADQLDLVLDGQENPRDYAMFAGSPPEEQKAMLQFLMSRGREVAREQLVSSFSNDEINRRARLANP